MRDTFVAIIIIGTEHYGSCLDDNGVGIVAATFAPVIVLVKVVRD